MREDKLKFWLAPPDGRPKKPISPEPSDEEINKTVLSLTKEDGPVMTWLWLVVERGKAKKAFQIFGFPMTAPVIKEAMKRLVDFLDEHPEPTPPELK